MQVEFWSIALRETYNAEKSANIASAVRKWVSNALSQRSLMPFATFRFVFIRVVIVQNRLVISEGRISHIFVLGQEIFGLLKMDNVIFVPGLEWFWLLRVIRMYPFLFEAVPNSSGSGGCLIFTRRNCYKCLRSSHVIAAISCG
jgi:hypothetical protein